MTMYSPSDEELNLALYLAEEVYRDFGQETGANSKYRSVDELFSGWQELKINDSGAIDLNPLSDENRFVDVKREIWNPLKEQGYTLPEAEEVFARVSVNEATKEAFIAFRGTDVHFGINTDHDDNVLGVGGGQATGQIYATFVMGDYYKDLLESHGYTVKATAHSKDGAFGAAWAASRGIDIVTVNAAAQENILPVGINGLEERTLTHERYNYGPITIKEWPAVLANTDAILDGSNIYNQITPGDLIKFLTHDLAGIDYVGPVHFAEDPEGNILIPSEYVSAFSYHSAMLAAILNKQPEIVTYMNAIPEFGRALFAGYSIEMQDPNLTKGNEKDFLNELYYDSASGGSVTDTLFSDLDILIDIADVDWRPTFKASLIHAVVQHARNQLEAPESHDFRPLIKINALGEAYVDITDLDTDSFGNLDDNPLRLFYRSDNIIKLGAVSPELLAELENVPEVLDTSTVVTKIIHSDTGTYPLVASTLGPGAEKLGVYALLNIVRTASGKEEQIGASWDLYNLVLEKGVVETGTGDLVFGAARIHEYTNESGGVVNKLSVDGQAVNYTTVYQDNFQQNIHEVVDKDGKTVSADITVIDHGIGKVFSGEAISITYPEDHTFEFVGGYVGNMIGQQFANGELFHDLLHKAAIKTLVQNTGQFLDLLGTGQNNIGESLFDPIFGLNGTNAQRADIFDDLSANLQAGLVSIVSSKLLEEISDAIEIDGVGGEVFDVVAGTITTGFTQAGFGLLFENLDAGVYSSLLSNGFNLSAPYHPPGLVGPPAPGGPTNGDILQANVLNALGAYAGSALASEILEPESQHAAIMGSLGSGLGTAIASGSAFASSGISAALSSTFATFGSIAPIIGTAIGAFIGQLAGTALGNLFSGGESPASWASVDFDRSTSTYKVGGNWAKDGAGSQISNQLAGSVLEGVNNIIEATGGALRSTSGAGSLTIGMRKGVFEVYVNGHGERFARSGDAIEFAALQLLKGTDLVGGHAVAMRAWHNSSAKTMLEFKEDLEVAEAFQTYLANPTGVLTLMMDQPDSEAAQAWAKILERATELELHLPHEKDIDGGWGELLRARGDIDPSLIPDIDGDRIVLTDPVTGEQTVLHHVIGPGYEIVRVEGTDGDDIIEVIVDGPSITHVDAGAGDDIVEGSDERDIILGGSGDDTINGNDGDDWINGGPGNDTVHGNGGTDLIYGGDDDDILFGDEDGDEIHGGQGNDTLEGLEGKDRLFGGDGNDILDGGASADKLYGGDGNDVLYGQGNDTLYGGKGDDTFYLTSHNNNIKIGRGDGHDTIHAVYHHNHAKKNYIYLDETIGANEVIGAVYRSDPKDVTFHILGENQSFTIKNFLDGKTYGRSTHIKIGNGEVGIHQHSIPLYYGNINETGYRHISLAGEAGTLPDHVLGAMEKRSSAEQNGKDAYAPYYWDGARVNVEHERSIIWSRINDTAVAYGDPDKASVIHWNGRATTIYGGSRGDSLKAGAHSLAYKIFGDSGDDYIDGGKKSDLLVGGLGNDVIRGHESSDKIYGGAGNDSINGDRGDDIIYGGYGDDSIKGSSGHDTIHGDQGNDEIKGGSGNDEIHGGDGNDVLNGDTDDDVIYGGVNNDKIEGGDGDDLLYGEENHDEIRGGKGNDYIFGGLHSDILLGGEGNDVIEGGTGNDIINGGQGHDILYGGVGDDIAEYLLPRYHYELTWQDDGGLRVSTTGDTDLLYDIETLRFGHYEDLAVADINKLPEAYNDNVQTLEDQAITFNPLLNDRDRNNDSFTLTALTTALYGLAIINQDGTITFTPNAHAHGTETIQYTITDEHGGTAEADITITIKPVNDAPVSAEDAFLNVEGQLISGNVLSDNGYGLDTDQEGDSLSVREETVETAKGALVSIAEDGSFVYDAKDVSPGFDTFTYVVLDTSGAEAEGKVTVEVLADHVVLGTDGNDRLSGDEGDNEIRGGVGSDRIYARGGDDILRGGEGNDYLWGYAGADVIDGGDGEDRVSYTNATEGVFADLQYSSYNEGEAEGDTYISIENLQGTRFSDALRGDQEDNKIYGWDGDDEIHGRDGNDSLYGQGGNDRLFGGNGNDYIYGNDGDDRLYGQDGNDTLVGGDGSDRLYGYDGDDVIYGQDGDDYLWGYGGADKLVGGEGTDRVSYTASTEGVRADLLSFNANTGDAAGDRYYSIENLQGTRYDDMLLGNNEANYVWGWDGNDTIYGRDGDDALYGQNGDDLVYGGDGNDYLYGGEGDDRLSGQDGNDILSGNNGSDRLYGYDGDDVLYGGDGNDYLWGYAGADTLHGGDGEDRASYSTANGGVHADMVNYQDNTGDATGDRYISIENLQGSNHDDFLAGDDKANKIYGQNGNDTLLGREGDDSLYGQNGDDIIHGGAGNDNLYGYNGNDILNGGDGDDYLVGNDGADTLRGGLGLDKLYGQGGEDVLFGGAGQTRLYGGADGDVFAFDEAALDQDIDIIYDFDLTAGDKIDISALLTDFDPDTQLITDHVKFADVGSYSYLEVSQSGESDGFVKIAQIRNNNLSGREMDLAISDQIITGHDVKLPVAPTVSIESVVVPGVNEVPSGGDEFTVNVFTQSYQQNPQTMSIGENQVLFTWYSNGSDGYDSGIATRIGHKNGDGTLELFDEIQVNEFTSQSQMDPNVALLPDGKVIFAWKSFDPALGGSLSEIAARIGTIQEDGTISFTNEFVVNENKEHMQNNPEILVTGDNKVVFTWASRDPGVDGDNYGISARTGTINNDSSITFGNEFTVNEYVAGYQDKPQVLNLADGRILFAWQTPAIEISGGSSPAITARIGDINDNNSMTLGQEFRISDISGSSQTDVQMVNLDDTKILFMWNGDEHAEGGTANGTIGRIVEINDDDTMVFGNVFAINQNGIGAQTKAQAIVLDNNKIVFTWESADPSIDESKGISARVGTLNDELDISFEEEFAVNQSTTGRQLDAKVSALNNSEIIFTWTSESATGDNDGNGIAARIFTLPLIEPDNIPLTINIDGDASLTHTLEITGAEGSFSLSAGFYNPKTNVWQLNEEDLSDLTLMPSADFAGELSLNVVAISTAGNGLEARSEEQPVSVTIDRTIHNVDGTSDDDILYGGIDTTILEGYDGADRFVFEKEMTDGAVDVIVDFDALEGDTIDISDLLTGFDPLEDAIEDFVKITDNGADSTLAIDADGGADNFVQIATLIDFVSITDEINLETSGNLITE